MKIGIGMHMAWQGPASFAASETLIVHDAFDNTLGVDASLEGVWSPDQINTPGGTYDTTVFGGSMAAMMLPAGQTYAQMLQAAGAGGTCCILQDCLEAASHCRIKIQTSDQEATFGLAIRCDSGGANGYFWDMYGTGDSARWLKRTAGSLTLVSSTPYTLAAATEYTLDVYDDGASLRGQIAGVDVLTAVTAIFAANTWNGFSTLNGSGGADIRVSQRKVWL